MSYLHDLQLDSHNTLTELSEIMNFFWVIWLVLNRGHQVHGADRQPADTNCGHLEIGRLAFQLHASLWPKYFTLIPWPASI